MYNFSIYDTHTAYDPKNSQDLKKDKINMKKPIQKMELSKYTKIYSYYLKQTVLWRSGGEHSP